MIKNLADLPNVENVLSHLLKSDYATEMERALVKPEPTVFENSINKVLSQRFEKYYDIVSSIAISEKLKELIYTYMRRLEVKNLKRILRAVHSGKLVTEDALIPLSKKITSVNFEELVKVRTIKEFVELLKETDYRIIAEKLKEYMKYDAISILEAKIDEAYYGRIIELSDGKSGKPVIKIVGTEVDLRNILTLLQLYKIGAHKDVLLNSIIPIGYRISIVRILDLIKKSPEYAKQMMLSTSYRNIVTRMDSLLDEGREEEAHALVDKTLRRIAMKNFRGVSAPIAYLLLIDIEASDLSKIIIGKYLKIEKEKISTLLSV